MNDSTHVTQEAVIFTPATLHEHWQGHRKLTRRMIEAFPEDKLFTYSIGGMRPFAELVYEFLGMAEPGIRGIATGKMGRCRKSGNQKGSAKALGQCYRCDQQYMADYSTRKMGTGRRGIWSMAGNWNIIHFLFYR